MIQINYLAVLAAALVNLAAGSLWFGPLFGRQWAEMAGVRMEGTNAPGLAGFYLLLFIGALVMAYVFDHFIIFAAAYTMSQGIAAGLQGGLYSWLGFVAPVTLATSLPERKPAGYWALINVYWLAVLLLNGMLLAVWR